MEYQDGQPLLGHAPAGAQRPGPKRMSRPQGTVPLSARDFGRQVAEFQVRVVVLNGFTALGIPVTEAMGQVCLGRGEPRPSNDLCNRAGQHDCVTETT